MSCDNQIQVVLMRIAMPSSGDEQIKLYKGMN